MPRGAQLKSVLPAAASCLIRRDFFPARLVLKLGCAKRLAIVQRANPLPALLKLLLPFVALTLLAERRLTRIDLDDLLDRARSWGERIGSDGDARS